MKLFIVYGIATLVVILYFTKEFRDEGYSSCDSCNSVSIHPNPK